MNYLFICGSITPTYCGIGKYVNKVISCFPSSVNVFYLANKEQSEYNQFDETVTKKYTVIESNLRKMSLKSLVELYKLTKKIKPEIVNIQHQTFAKNYFDSIFNLIVKLANPKTKTINTIHEFEHFGKLGKVRLALAGLFSNKILFSDPRQEKLYNIFTRNFFKNKTKVTIIGNNVNNQLTSYELNYEPSSPNNSVLNLGYHGFIQPAKGVFELLEALNNYNGEFKLYILGEFKPLLNYETKSEVIEYQQKCLNLINSNQKLKKNVIITGDIDPSSQQFKQILEQVDLLVFPFQDYCTMRRSSFFGALLASNSLAFSSYKEGISEKELQVFQGISNTFESILDFLNKFHILDNSSKQEIYKQQLSFKNNLANNESERERIKQDLF